MRRPRLDAPGLAQHLTHRGVNRAATFMDDEDHAAYLQDLGECSRVHAVSVHGYVLMSNHVHLLVSAPEAGAVSRMMQAVGRRYVRRVNAKYGRSGTLWEGRYKSSLVDSDNYLLTCLRYTELNPVRAAMAADPEAYRWSSVHGHLYRKVDPLLSQHAVFLALGGDPAVRAERYRALLDEAIAAEDIYAIRRHLQQERALGSPRFQVMVEAALGRPAALRPRGRPRKPEP